MPLCIDRCPCIAQPHGAALVHSYTLHAPYACMFSVFLFTVVFFFFVF